MYWFWTSNAHVELWNDINLWRYLGGFLRIALTFELRKRNNIEKFSMEVTVEVDNQRNCLVMCLDQMAGFAITSFRSRDFPPSVLKSFYDISINVCMNELLLQLVVKIWRVEFEGDFVCIKRHVCTKLILRACSSGILIEIVTHMNILRVRVHYPYPYTDIGVS